MIKMTVWEFMEIYAWYVNECQKEGVTPKSEEEYWAEMEEG